MITRLASTIVQLISLVLLQGCVAGSTGYSTNLVLPGYESGKPVEVELHRHLRRFASQSSGQSYFCFYRYNDHMNFIAVPLDYKGKEVSARLYRYGCKLPPLIGGNVRIEYYFEYVVDGVTNRTRPRVLTRSGFVGSDDI
jgi:hypothetical protein